MSEGMSGNMAGSASNAMAMGASKSLADIAKELQADVLLQGTVMREGDAIRVRAALIGTEPLRSIWRRNYSRTIRELVDLQQNLAHAVAAAINLRAPIAPLPRAIGPTTILRRTRRYLRGSYYQAHWRLPQAVDAFRGAVDLDPTHAPAQAGLARAYYFLGFFGDIPPSVALGGMRRAATAALEADPLIAEGHAQLALVKMLQDWDWAGAEQHFRRALRSVQITRKSATISHISCWVRAGSANRWSRRRRRVRSIQ